MKMVTRLVTAVFAAVVLVAGVAHAGTTKEGFKMMNAGELQKEITANASAVHIYDANSNETRKSDGMIPGAVALDSASKYDTAKTLPADKNAEVVFYCANTQCMASHQAAKRAVEAGYKNVAVMSDGIQGWKKAGLKTQSM